MTREEEIKQYLNERNIPTDSLEANSIMEGINWADENPKEGLVSIDKVREWLKDNTNPIFYSGNGWTTEEFIDNFEKAMEE